MKRLTEWGKWARGGHYELQAKSSWLLVMQGKVQYSKRLTPMITDEVALAVDKAVVRLSRQRLLAYQAVFMYYVVGMSVNEIAKTLSRMQKRRVTNYLISKELSFGEGFVLSQLDLQF